MREAGDTALEARLGHLRRVEAYLNYIIPSPERPVTYRFTPPPGTPDRRPRFTKYLVAIHNARPLAEELALDRQGFALLRRATKVSNFFDDRQVKSIYYPEVEELVASYTGAPRVLVFDYNLRSGQRARSGQDGAREPVRYAHNDYTLDSGPRRVRELMGAQAAALLEGRFVFINVWRPLSEPVRDTPLAVCDAHTIDSADWVASELRYPDRSGEVYNLNYAPAHRWFYFPEMTREELLLLKCYDSDLTRARFTAHSAFDDPTAPAGVPPRESIEVRTIAFYPR